MADIPVGNLEVLIKANADQFRKELADVNAKLNVLNKTTKGVSSAVGGNLVKSITKANIASKLLVGVAKKVGNSIFNAGRKVMSLGSQYTRIKVATDTVTRNLGITRKEVDNLRNSLEDANTYGIKAEEVIKTLAMSGLVDMAKNLKTVDARTGEFATGVSALVLTMKDLAAAAGIESAEGMRKVTEFIKQGNSGALEGLVAIGNLGTEYKAFAASLGKTRTELTANEESLARLNIVMREGEKAFGAYAATMQTSGKTMNSINAVIRTLHELLGNYLEPVFASVTRAVYLFVSGIRKALIGNAEEFKAWANKVAAYVVAVVRILGTLLSKIPFMGKYFKGLADFALKPVTQAVDSLADSTGNLSSNLDSASDSTSSLKKELLGLVGFDEMNVLQKEDAGTGIGTGTGIGIGGINANDLIDTSTLNESIDEINAMADEIEDKLRPKFEAIAEALEPVLDFLRPIFEFLTDNWEIILAIAGGLWLFIKVVGIVTTVIGTLTTVWTFLTGVFGVVVTVVGTIISIFSALLATGALVPILIGILIALLIAAVVIIIKNWDKIKEFFIELWERIKKIWGTVAAWFTEKVVTPIKNIFIDMWDKLKNGAKDVWDEIKRIWGIVSTWFNEKVVTPVKDFFANMWDKLKSGARNAWEGIKKPFASVATWFKNIFKRAWEGVKNVFSKGGKIFDGIKEGIGSAFKNVVNTLIGGINFIISIPFNAINNMIRKLREISVLGAKPFKNFSTFYVPRIPYLAEGGVVSSPTVAMLGEAGKEAIVPLKDNAAWMDNLANRINKEDGGVINLKVEVGGEKIYEKTLKYMKEKSLLTNTNLLGL